MTNVKAVDSYLRLGGLIILVFGVVAGVTLIGRIQEVRERAAVPQGEYSAPTLYFLPSEINVLTDSSDETYDIYLDTAGYEVNGAVFEIKFDTAVIKIKDIVEGDILRLVIDKSVEGGTAYLSVVIADETKPFVGVGKVATVVFDTFSTPTTTYFTFEPNTQIHTKALTSNILDKALKGTVHIGLPSTPTPTSIVEPTATASPTIAPTSTPTEIPTPIPTVCIKIGDANGDCRVDGVDFVIWLLHFGQTTQNGPADGDFNSDGVVDGKDYGLWFVNAEI